MPYINPTNVMTEDCLLVWDGLSKPDTKESTGELEYRVEVAVKKNSQTHSELYSISEKAAAEKYPSGKPHGFKEALTEFDPAKYPELTDYVRLRATAKQPCDTYLQSSHSSPAEFGQKSYAGCGVRLIVSPFIYMPSKETKNQTGAKFWLNGCQLTNLDLPKLSVASGLTGREVANAFGATPSAGTAFTQPAPSTPPPVAAATTPPAPTAPPVVPAPNPGILTAGAPTPPAPPVPPTPPAPPAAPAGPVATAALTALGQTVESMLAAGWSMDQLKQQNYVA